VPSYQRADLDVLLRPAPDLHRAELRGELLRELVLQALCDMETGSRPCKGLPMLRIFAITAPSTAASTSASAKTRNGGVATQLHRGRSSPGGLLDQLAPDLGRAGERQLAQPRVAMIGFETPLEELEVSTLSTPAGRPDCSRIWREREHRQRRLLRGLITIVQPAATAGPILRVPIAIGSSRA
jgi:hypothetical protein